MTMTDIHDNNQLLKFACEDLRGVQSLILTVTDHPEYANAYQVMSIIDRTLVSGTNGWMRSGCKGEVDDNR